MTKKFMLPLFLIFSIFMVGSIDARSIYSNTNESTYTYNTAIPYAYIAGVTFHKKFTNIYLSDGSVWKTPLYSNNTEPSNWLVNDQVIIYPRSSWSKDDRFTIYNTRTTKSVDVSIACCSCPLLEGSLQINEIPSSGNILTIQNPLGNLHYFQIAEEDVWRMKGWSVTDCIVIGYSKDTYTKDNYAFPYMLINMNTLDHVYAEHILYTY